MEVDMAKISLKEAMIDFINMFVEAMYKDDSRKRYSSEEVMDFIYKAMYRLSLSYVDRVDDVATREMSFEVDRLNNIVEGLRDENRRLRDKEPI
jgi:hypothetical protein